MIKKKKGLLNGRQNELKKKIRKWFCDFRFPCFFLICLIRPQIRMSDKTRGKEQEESENKKTTTMT